MDLKKRFRVRLRVTIALAAALIVVLLAVSIVGFLFLRNRQVALSIADGEMDKATNALIDHFNGLLEPVARVVEATAVLAKIDRSGLHRVETLRYFLDGLETLPQADSLYIGFASDGAFYETLRIGGGINQYGPNGQKPPSSARFALRLLDTSLGERADSFIYIVRWGHIVGVERGLPQYDPRQRPWYLAAWNTPGTVTSDVYPFAASGKPGITLSHRIATDDGVAIGAVGADVSLEVLSQFVERERVGRNGLVFIIDNQDRLIASPRSTGSAPAARNSIEMVPAAAAPDHRIPEATRLRSQNKADKFRATIDGERYLLSFTSFDWQSGN
jgi:adenylate cyclase